MKRLNPILAALLIGFVAATAIYLIRPGGEEGMVFAGDLLYVLFAAIAAVFGVLAARSHAAGTPQRKVLTLLALMAAADVIAGIVFAVYELGLGVRNPFPTIAEGLWFLFYVFGIAAMLALAKRLWKVIDQWKILTACAATLLLVAVTYGSVLHPIAVSADATLLEKLMSAMYPLGDIALIGFSLLLFLSLRGNLFGRSWKTFLIAFVIYSIADLSYIHKTFLGTYMTGDFVDLFWFAGQLMMAYAFYQQLQTGGK